MRRSKMSARVFSFAKGVKQLMETLSEKEVEAIAQFVRTNSIENIAEMLLFVLGFKSSLLGTRYIREGIVQKYSETDLSCRELYSNIAQKYNTVYSRVERSIRHAINASHGNGYLKRMNDLFRCNVVNCKYSPTNSEFLSEICTWVHIKKSQTEESFL